MYYDKKQIFVKKKDREEGNHTMKTLIAKLSQILKLKNGKFVYLVARVV
jgi:hypothetical protein